MNTTLLLLAEHGRADLPLDLVAERYLGLDHRSAAYRARSQKAPWLVSVADLATWIDTARDQAAADWRARAHAR